ncbi:hypothetical protein B566_EDAN008055 [Ephemera danica]|nr:hypothetical protein B566_EDAN008055 [Ephemera danica]
MMHALIFLVLLASASFATAINNGSPAVTGEIAFAVSIQNNQGQHVCAGSFIGRDVVLTSATCVDAAKVNDGQVVGGRVDLSTSDGSVHTAQTIIIHPDFAVDANGIPVHDIAIITLKTMFPIDENHGAAFVPAQNITQNEGAIDTVAGWGATVEGGPNSMLLMKAEVPLLNTAQCSDSYAQIGGVKMNQICAGGNGVNTCTGDGGSPLTRQGYLWGIASWGTGCGNSEYPLGVYTQTSMYSDWINANRP